jgi:glutamate/tyrosine decarboxylase-like PLP-dependent enzyme
MIDSKISKNFIAPDSSNRLDIENTINKLITQLIDFLSNANKYSPYPEVKIFSREHFNIPNNGLNIDEIQTSLNTIYTHSMNPANKNYIGHMDSVSNIYAILGEMIAAAINNNMLSLEMSPFLTQLEYGLIKEFCDLFGLSKNSGGIIVSGGSLANLQALIIARNHTLNLQGGCLIGVNQTPVILCSELAHASISKAAMLMGIGVQNVIKVAINEHLQMCETDLEIKISKSLVNNCKPIAIVATAGTTVTGSIDSITNISNIANKYSIWLHVDAIYGGALIFSENYKHLIQGINKANSISFNPQKWLYVAKTSSMVLFNDFNNMVNNFRIAAPYMKEQENYINLGEITIQGSHHAEVLKLWLSLLAIGKNGYNQLITHGYELTSICKQEIDKRNFLKLVTTPEVNICCVRIALDNYDNDEITLKIHEYLLKQGFFVSIPRLLGKLCLRMVLLNPFTDNTVIINFFNEIDKFFASLKKSN